MQPSAKSWPASTTSAGLWDQGQSSRHFKRDVGVMPQLFQMAARIA
jgi:hypothetical protein